MPKIGKNSSKLQPNLHNQFPMKHISLVFIFLLSLKLSAQKLTQTVRGTVTEVGNSRSLKGISVTIQDSNFGAITADNGTFTIPNVPLGRYGILISGVGFETLLLSEILVEAGKEKVLEIKLKRQAVQLAEAVVRASQSPALGSVQTITQEQTLRYAATFFDAARLATSFPGVVAANDQANGLVIRGNSPNGMQWRMEGVEIVNPNHLSNAGTFSDRPTQTGGGTTIFSAQLLDRADFLTGAFPAEYGNALSGVMDVHLRKGNNQKHEFTAQAGLIGLDFAAEGPLSRKNGSSYLVNYRYSFTGLLAAMGVKFGGEAIRFQDLSFNLSFPTAKAGLFTVFGMGGNSSNIYEAERDVSKWKFDKDGEDISFKSNMTAIGFTHKIGLSPKATLSTTGAYSSSLNSRIETVLDDKSYMGLSNSRDKMDKQKLSFTTKVSYKINSTSILNVGTFLTQQTDIVNGIGMASGIDEKLTGLIIQPYISFSSALSNKLSLQTGLHYLNYTFNNSSSIEPRLALALQATPTNKLTLSYGLHSQIQLPQIYLYSSNIGFSRSNANLGLTKSHQFVLGYEKILKNSSKLKFEGYFTSLFNVPIDINYYSTLNLIESSTTDGKMLQNAGTGKNYGIEATYEKYLTKNYYVIVAGSLYKSTFVGADGVERSTRFDGGHTFSFTGGKELIRKNDKRLGINTKVLWLGGYRDTPFLGKIYDYSKVNTIKLKDYFRMDLRVYWKRNKPSFTRTWSLDIQNLTNTENEAYSYYDFRAGQIVQKFQLGLIPVLNYKVEF
jgi:CarboxypepD_reg-like domain/TonB-dependent Receptor Plug Domain